VGPTHVLSKTALLMPSEVSAQAYRNGIPQQPHLEACAASSQVLRGRTAIVRLGFVEHGSSVSVVGPTVRTSFAKRAFRDAPGALGTIPVSRELTVWRHVI